jgi:hypothetical protein
VNTLILIFQAVLLIAFGILAALAKYYFPGYLKKKGENLATREDVEEITDKIERTRVQYLSSIERLKSELTISSEQQSKLKEKEREALLTFFEDCLILINEKLTFNFGDMTYDEGKFLIEYQRSLDHLFTRIIVDYHRLLLYFSAEDQLLNAAVSLVQAVIEVRKIYRKNFSKFKKSLMEESEAIVSGDKKAFHARATETDVASDEYYSYLNPAVDKLRTTFGEYIHALNIHFKSMGSIKMPESLV